MAVVTGRPTLAPWVLASLAAVNISQADPGIDLLRVRSKLLWLLCLLLAPLAPRSSTAVSWVLSSSFIRLGTRLTATGLAAERSGEGQGTKLQW